MINTVKQKVATVFYRDNQRSQKIVKNIILSFGVKAGSVLIGLILVPMTINYINPIQYGVWLTISSVVGWMSFFDIGLGNGLRNKLADALAHNKYEDARKYISTTYASLAIISSLLFVVFWFINSYIDWRTFFNIPSSINEDVHLVLLIVAGTFCLQFVVQLINTVLTATHEPALAAFISFLGQCCLLITIIILKSYVPGSLHVLVWALTLVPILVFIIASVILYKTKLRAIAPSFRNIDFSYARNILSIGNTFFFIQIGALVLLQTDNMIIANIIGPQAVTQFNVSYKLFSVVSMGFVIIMTPYWSAFTDAYAKSDYEWMKSSVKRLRKIWFLISLIIVPGLVLISKPLYKLWIGDAVDVTYSVTISIGLYIISYTCLALNCFFLNGVGKLRIQLILYIAVCVFNIPIGIGLGMYFGIEGIIMSNVLMFVIMDVLLWIQIDKIISRKASGLWNA